MTLIWFHLSDAQVAAALMLGIGAFIVALAVYVVAAYDQPDLYHEEPEEWVRIIGPVPDRPYATQVGPTGAVGPRDVSGVQGIVGPMGSVYDWQESGLE